VPIAYQNMIASGQGEKMILLKNVIEILISEGYLKSGMFIPPIPPTHGSCCTCQTCGQFHDECVCSHNELLAKLILLKK